jgi:hypothetical protein
VPDDNEAVNLLKQLVTDFPARPEFRLDLAVAYRQRTVVVSATGRSRDARDDANEALSIAKQLVAEFPSRPEFREELALDHENIAFWLDDHHYYKLAVQESDSTVSIYKQLAAEFPSRPGFRERLVKALLNRSSLQNRADRPKESEKDANEAVSIGESLVADFPNRPDLRLNLAGAYHNLAGFHVQREDWAAAKGLLLEGRPHLLAALKANPREPDSRDFYARHLGVLTKVHAALLEQEEAVRAAQTRRDLGWNAPADAYNAACFLSKCIPTVAKHGKLDATQRKEAGQFYGDAAVKLLREAVAKGFKNVAHMKHDTDLNPLRQREDFQKLIAGLEEFRKLNAGLEAMGK